RRSEQQEDADWPALGSQAGLEHLNVRNNHPRGGRLAHHLLRQDRGQVLSRLHRLLLGPRCGWRVLGSVDHKTLSIISSSWPRTFIQVVYWRHLRNSIYLCLASKNEWIASPIRELACPSTRSEERRVGKGGRSWW